MATQGWRVLKAILNEGGFETVGETTNGMEVLCKCQQLKPEVQCLDIICPRKTALRH